MKVFDTSLVHPLAFLAELSPGTTSICEYTERQFNALLTHKHGDPQAGKYTAGDLVLPLSPIDPNHVSLQVVVINKMDFAIRHTEKSYESVANNGVFVAWPQTAVYKMDHDDFVGQITYKDKGIIPGRTEHAGKVRFGLGRYLFMPNYDNFVKAVDEVREENKPQPSFGPITDVPPRIPEPEWTEHKFTNLFGAMSFEGVDKKQLGAEIAVGWDFSPFARPKMSGLFITPTKEVPLMNVTSRLSSYEGLSSFVKKWVNHENKKEGSVNKFHYAHSKSEKIEVTASMAGRYCTGKITPYSKTILMVIQPSEAN